MMASCCWLGSACERSSWMVLLVFGCLFFGSAGSRLTCLAVHWIGLFSPSCLLYMRLLLALGMFVLCFFSMGACSRFCLGFWLPSSLYILFLFATFVAWLPLILIYSYIWSKKKKSSCSAYREKEWSKINNKKIHKNPSLIKIEALGLNSTRDKINS